MLTLIGTLVSQQSAMTQTDTGASPAAGATGAAVWPTNSINSNSPAGTETALSNAAVTASSDAAPAVAANAPAADTSSTATTAGTTATNAADTTPAASTPAAMPAATDASAAAAATNTPAPAADTSAAATNTPAAATAMAQTNGVTPPVATPAAAAGAAAPMGTNTASIPLISFQDVPLTVAIENLARQAGINYLLDPKIAYGQPDSTGQVKQEPTLSIRWENVTAEQALLALLNNYDLQLVQDPQTKIGRITMKDPSAPPPLITRVIQLKYASTTNMVQSVQAAFTDRRSHVISDVRTSQLVVVATQNEQDQVDTLIQELDKPTRQVLIETKLVEVSSTPQTAKGVDWSGTLANQNVSFGNGTLTAGSSTTTMPGTPVTTKFPSGATTTTTPNYTTQTSVTTTPSPASIPGGLSWNTLAGWTPSIGFLNADGLQAVLSFLNATFDAQTLSTPRVVTLDNEPALVSVTRQFPVINVTASTAGVSSGSSTITYSNIGTTLQVTPRITANDYVWLKVIPDVSSFFATVTKVIAGTEYQADEFDSRHIDTQVMVPNANTLVMGGLIQDNPTAQYTQVPVLGNIPVLGWAFKSEAVSMNKDNLIIFITPTIVKDEDFQPSTTDFLASRPQPMKEPMNPNSAWDRPEADWSNPAPRPGEFNTGTSAQ